MPIPSNLVNAIEARKKSKERNDKIILKIISDYNGLTSKQIATWISKLEDKPDLKRSFLINSLKRLEDAGKIITSSEFVHGKLIKKYKRKYSDKITVTIPNGTAFKDIQDEPYAYVIDWTTIIISTKNNKEFNRPASPNQVSPQPIKLKLKKIMQNKFELPKEFIHFYDLQPGSFTFDYEYPSKKQNIIDHIIIKIIRNASSINVNKSKPIKCVLILEDSIIFGNTLKDAFEDEGHSVTITHTVDEFIKALKKNGKSFDIISLDNKVDNQYIAKEMSIEIKYNAPQAHIGLISSQFNDSEREVFQDLAFEFILKKNPRRGKGSIDLEEFLAWVSTV